MEICNRSVKSRNPEEKISPEVQQFTGEIPKLFKRKNRVKHYKIKLNMKNDAKISQQKGRRVPNQLQDEVDRDIEKLLKEGHIQRVEKIRRIHSTIGYNSKRR